MIPGFLRLGSAYEIGGKVQDRIVVESCGKPFLRQFDTVSLDARKSYLQRVAVWPNGLHLDRFPRWLRRRNHRLCVEIKWNTEHVRIFDVEPPFVIQIVRLTTESAPDDLLAEQLRAKCSDAEYVRDRVRIPTFGQHSNRNYAAD